MKTAEEWAKEESSVWEETGRLSGYVAHHVDEFLMSDAARLVEGYGDKTLACSPESRIRAVMDSKPKHFKP
jgi:hypothetical protein